MAWCDNTGESLALKLRKGSAGSNTVSDHIEVLDEAITQIPVRYRRNLLITLDGAGASHGLVNHITNLNASPWQTVQYSTGWKLGARERTAINRAPQHSWDYVLDAEAAPRDLAEAGVIELTALVRKDQMVTSWLTGPKTCASSPAARNPTPAHNCLCSKRSMGGATSSWPPTPGATA